MTPILPDDLKGIYSPEKYAKQQEYQRTNSRFGFIFGGFSFMLMVAVLLSGFLGRIDNYLREYTDHFLVLPLLFFAFLMIVNEIISFPFDWYATFTIEERFGFNQSTRKLFVVDWLKDIALNMLLGGIVVSVVLFIYHYTEKEFWLLAWLVVSGFSLVMTFFYSEWIVPLFNKQTPLEEGELRDALESFSRKAGFRLTNIFVMDGSKRSTKANAYFTGLWKKKRIVLFDTLINDLNTEEIVAVLAHEIGHYKKKHIVYALLLSILTTGITFYILSLFLGSVRLAEALGGTIASFHLGIIGFAFLLAPISEISGLAINYISRKNEYEADAFVAQFGLGDALISALKKTSVQSLSNLNPHPLSVFWYYSHPTLLQRIRHIKLSA